MNAFHPDYMNLKYLDRSSIKTYYYISQLFDTKSLNICNISTVFTPPDAMYEVLTVLTSIVLMLPSVCCFVSLFCIIFVYFIMKSVIQITLTIVMIIRNKNTETPSLPDIRR